MLAYTKSMKVKTVAVIEFFILVWIALFSFDLLPRNYNEFQGICSRTWTKDPKQYEICMQPYYRQTGLDKYMVGAGLAGLILVPVFLSRRKF